MVSENYNKMIEAVCCSPKRDTAAERAVLEAMGYCVVPNDKWGDYIEGNGFAVVNYSTGRAVIGRYKSYRSGYRITDIYRGSAYGYNRWRKNMNVFKIVRSKFDLKGFLDTPEREYLRRNEETAGQRRRRECKNTLDSYRTDVKRCEEDLQRAINALVQAELSLEEAKINQCKAKNIINSRIKEHGIKAELERDGMNGIDCAIKYGEGVEGKC